jgi:hypothetical protein
VTNHSSLSCKNKNKNKIKKIIQACHCFVDLATIFPICWNRVNFTTVKLEERRENQPIDKRMQESTANLTSTNKRKNPKQRTTTSWLKIKEGT